MINVPELNLPHYNILIAQEDWLYQILNYIIGRSSLRPFIIGLILNLQFHGGWLKLTRLNQIDFKIFYLLAQEKKGIIINLVRLWLTIKIWKMVERRIGGPFKFCNSTPLWHNFNFVCGNRPFVQPSWSSLGVNTCGDMYDNQGLCSFQALRAKFCLPASAYFVFLQLRSALKAYGVPWSSSISSHPMRDWIAPSAGRPSVSLIYNKIIDCITKPLSIKTIWNRELSDFNLSVDWERVWSNLSLTSKNLAHRLIHFKVIHRAYITPYKRFKMKLQSNLNCHICNTTSSGTFLHMFWECPVVISLWTHVNLVLSSLLRIDWSVNPSLCLLNDDSGLCISSMQKRMLFAGFTAVKKTIIQNWFTPHMCREAYWIRSLLQIVSCECTTARVGGARPSTIEAWQCFLLNIRDYLKE